MPTSKSLLSPLFLALTLTLTLTHSFTLLPMPCNVSLTNQCRASLYFIPPHPITSKQASLLFSIPPESVSRTKDGFLIRVSCGCPADHQVFVSGTAYSVEYGDTWEIVGEKFGFLVEERLEKKLVPLTNVTLDFLCGCVRGVELVTYTIQPGDTMYLISERFGVEMGEVVRLNKVKDEDLIYAGDKLFIPTSANLASLIVPDEIGSNARSSSKFRKRIILSTIILAVVVILAILVLRIYYKRRLQKQHEASPVGTRSSPSSSLSLCVRGSNSRLNYLSVPKDSKESSLSSYSVKTTVFPYGEVCDATYNFSSGQKIGQGSYGSVYRGKLRGLVVAVKKMNSTKSKEFFAELNILCKVSHSNLVKLIGYSTGADSLCLVYEFAENGTLSDHLHNPSVRGCKPLSWNLRMQIALDVAKGLEYIHVHIMPFYVHRDVKPSNILLDSNFRAKVADFGLVKLLEHSPEVGAATSKIVGTFGYLAPEYVRDGCVTPKADVYGYGVVLMELITGKRALTWGKGVGDAQHEPQSVVDLVLSALEDDHDPVASFSEIIDSNLIYYCKDSLFQMALLSKDCVDEDWRRRPDMSQVVLRLSNIATNKQ